MIESEFEFGFEIEFEIVIGIESEFEIALEFELGAALEFGFKELTFGPISIPTGVQFALRTVPGASPVAHRRVRPAAPGRDPEN